MQLSIGKLAALSIGLLVAVTIVTTGAGLYLLQSNYRSQENHHEAEARDGVHNAATALHNQVRFYQGMLQLMASNPEVGDLFEFAETPEMTAWSQSVGRLLPGTLGTALVSTEGVVFGDPISLRVGPGDDPRRPVYVRHPATGQQLFEPVRTAAEPAQARRIFVLPPYSCASRKLRQIE